MSQHKQDIDSHLNNLIFSLYNFAKVKSRDPKQDANNAFIPLEILRMLKKKIGANLTTDEHKLITKLINELEGKPGAEEPQFEQLSIYEQQVEMLMTQPAKTYRFSSTVETAFSEIEVNRTKIQLMLGDLTAHSAEAIISPDNTDLWMEQGVASVIRLKGGESIRKEARQAGSVKLGEVVVTGAGDLTQRYVFHTAIMVPDQDIKQEHIHMALKNIFSTAEDKQVKSLAIPALGTGSSRFPYNILAKTMIQYTIMYFMSAAQTSIGLVVISLFNREAYHNFIEQFRIAASANSLKVVDYT